MTTWFKKTITAVLSKGGYTIQKIERPGVASPFVLHKFEKPDGTFDYERYRRLQTEGNRNHLESIWVRDENVRFLSDYIRTVVGSPVFGICHGTRRGMEQKWFSENLDCRVIGTEISDTAMQFPNTIQWDFHEVMPEWLGAVDFIYSNSLDHSYDPEKCLNAWTSCLRQGGICIIEHSTMHDTGGATELDPFGASISIMPYLIVTWGKGRYYVREILNAPAKDAVLKYVSEPAESYLKFIIIQKT